MKKGFTLIELLAVIVILAVIALILTPAISKIVENAKKATAKESTIYYVDAVEKQMAISKFNKVKVINPGEYDVLTLKNEYDVYVKGKYPASGTVTVGEDSVIEAEICVNKYLVNYKDKTATVLRKCDEPEPEVIDASMVQYSEDKTVADVLDELHERMN